MSLPTKLTTPASQIYATSEERKQRNRQAQAAFRERRTEYIKQLESTIKIHEETLQTLQQSHRSAADECLMLRYKNSLLERVLVEKGKQIDQALISRLELTHENRNRCSGRATAKRGKPKFGSNSNASPSSCISAHTTVCGE